MDKALGAECVDEDEFVHQELELTAGQGFVAGLKLLCALHGDAIDDELEDARSEKEVDCAVVGEVCAFLGNKGSS